MEGIILKQVDMAKKIRKFNLTPIGLVLLIVQLSYGQHTALNEPFRHTFSIVAIDKEQNLMGIGVQSHWFSVGNVVAWAESNVGVVATQSFVNKSFGINGLALIKSGKTAQEALDALLSEDPGREVRQVAIVDAKGNLAVHTGKNCVDFAAHIKGKNYAVQSNMMLNDKVPSAMANAFEEKSDLPLAERIMAALNAAQAVGGDIRGKQSAAIRIVKINGDKLPWDDNFVVDLRVDDATEPLAELERLLKVQRAYEYMNAGDLAIEKGEMAEALKMYDAAMRMFPENLEMQYWTAISIINSGDYTKGEAMLKKIYEKDLNWKEMTKRLPKAGLLTIPKEDLKRFTE